MNLKSWAGVVELQAKLPVAMLASLPYASSSLAPLLSVQHPAEAPAWAENDRPSAWASADRFQMEVASLCCKCVIVKGCFWVLNEAIHRFTWKCLICARLY